MIWERRGRGRFPFCWRKSNRLDTFCAGLEKAMEAKKRERALTKFRETNNLSDQVNVDLTYAVDFNLAVCYHANKDYQEALDHFTGVGRAPVQKTLMLL